MKTSRLQEDFPLIGRFNYLNTHGIGLTPKPVMEEVHSLLDQGIDSPPFEPIYHFYLKTVEEARILFSQLIRCRAEELSLQPSSSAGLNLVAEMVKLRPGDNIVTDDLNFPSAVWPWRTPAMMKAGVKVKVVRNRSGRVDLEDFEKVIDTKTKIVTTSLVSFVNGFRTDAEGLGKLAASKGSYFLLDATLGCGYEDIDVKKWGVDFFVTSNYKWLMGQFGSAEFYCRKELMDQLESPHAGYFSHEEPPYPRSRGKRPLENRLLTFRRARTSRQFEIGNQDYLSLFFLLKSLEYARRVGYSEIRKRAYRLRDLMIEGLEGAGAEIHSPVDQANRSLEIFFGVRGMSTRDLYTVLKKKGIWAGTSAWDLSDQSGVRASVHFYNLEQDVEALTKAVAGIKK